MFNFFQKKEQPIVELKSSTLVFGRNGEFISRVDLSDNLQIKNNISVQTIINKQFAIISQPEIIVKKKTDQGDINASNEPYFKDFLSWIYKPNSIPYPTNKDHIIKYLMQYQYLKGIYGIIFIFDKAMRFKSICLAQNIVMKNSSYKTSYHVTIKNYQTGLIFDYNPAFGMFSCNHDGDRYLLQVDGNLDNETMTYNPEFQNAIKYIKLQNIVSSFAVSFYENSCFPSLMVTVSYEAQNKTNNITPHLSPDQTKQFERAVEDIKAQMKEGQGSSGGAIVTSNPNIRVKIDPLNIPANAKEITDLDDLAAKKIFSYVDGGSYSGFMGVDEYSNNAIIRIKGMYDAAFRTFDYMCLKQMTSAMRNIVRYMDNKIDVDSYYLDLDTSGVRIFQEVMMQLGIQLVQNNIYTINEVRDILGNVLPEFRKYGEKDFLNVVNSQLSGNKTKPSPETINNS
jgi:hypothetical protein